jgi:TRAP transporter TAXI family solute receptor
MIMTGSRTTRSSRFAWAISVVFFLALAACAPADNKVRLSIATGGTGGVFYPYGGGIAKIITDNIPNVEATAEVTAASVDNLKFIRDRKADLAFTTADTLADAVMGKEAFQGTPLPIRTVALLYTNYTQVVTLASSPIRTIPDLKGKVVSTGAAGSGAEVTAFRVLEAFGINPAGDIQKQSLGVSQSADALKDGKIDAFFWSGGLPTAALLDLGHTPGITLRLIPNGEALESMRNKYGASLYLPGNIPIQTYPDLESDIAVVSVPNLLVVHQDMDEDLVYNITRVLFEYRDALVAIHPEAKNLSLKNAVQGSPAPFHEGAIRFYQEQKAWPQ